MSKKNLEVVIKGNQVSLSKLTFDNLGKLVTFLKKHHNLFDYFIEKVDSDTFLLIDNKTEFIDKNTNESIKDMFTFNSNEDSEFIINEDFGIRYYDTSNGIIGVAKFYDSNPNEIITDSDGYIDIETMADEFDKEDYEYPFDTQYVDSKWVVIMNKKEYDIDPDDVDGFLMEQNLNGD